MRTLARPLAAGDVRRELLLDALHAVRVAAIGAHFRCLRRLRGVVGRERGAGEGHDENGSGKRTREGRMTLHFQVLLLGANTVWQDGHCFYYTTLGFGVKRDTDLIR